jgi:hypothetical protein
MALVDLSAVVGFAAVTLAAIRRLPFAFTLYALGLLLLSVLTPRTDVPNALASSSRFMLEAFPVFIALGLWTARRRWLETLLVAAGFLAQGVFCFAFLSGRYPIF